MEKFCKSNRLGVVTFVQEAEVSIDYLCDQSIASYCDVSILIIP